MKIENEPHPLLAVANFAFDLNSGGMYVHADAVHRFANKDLAPLLTVEQTESIVHPTSNYLACPYVLYGLMRQNTEFYPLPVNTNPKTPQHVALLEYSTEEYMGIHWRLLRNIWGGSQNYDKSRATPITADELPTFLDWATKNGLVIADPKILAKIQPADSPDRLLIHLLRAGVQINEALHRETRNKLMVSDYYRDSILLAAVHKLACMLAVTHQIVQDAISQKNPIPYGYRPDDMEESWNNSLALPVPSLGEVFEHALNVFKSYASEGDRLVAYLFPLRDFYDLVHL